MKVSLDIHSLNIYRPWKLLLYYTTKSAFFPLFGFSAWEQKKREKEPYLIAPQRDRGDKETGTHPRGNTCENTDTHCSYHTAGRGIMKSGRSERNNHWNAQSERNSNKRGKGGTAHVHVQRNHLYTASKKLQ